MTENKVKPQDAVPICCPRCGKTHSKPLPLVPVPETFRLCHGCATGPPEYDTGKPAVEHDSPGITRASESGVFVLVLVAVLLTIGLANSNAAWLVGGVALYALGLVLLIGSLIAMIAVGVYLGNRYSK